MQENVSSLASYLQGIIKQVSVDESMSQFLIPIYFYWWYMLPPVYLPNNKNKHAFQNSVQSPEGCYDPLVNTNPMSVIQNMFTRQTSLCYLQLFISILMIQCHLLLYSLGFIFKSFILYKPISNGTLSSTLAWKIPWMEEHSRLKSMGSQRVRRDSATSLSLFISNNII